MKKEASGSLRRAREVAGNFSLHIANLIAPAIIAVISVPVLTRELEREEYGALAIAVGWSTVIGLLGYGWAASTIGRLSPGAPYEFQTTVASVTYRRCVQVSALALVFGVAVSLLGNARSHQSVGVGLLIAGAGIPLNLRIAEERTIGRNRRYTIFMVLQVAASSLVPIAAVLVGARSGIVIGNLVALCLFAASAGAVASRIQLLRVPVDPLVKMRVMTFAKPLVLAGAALALVGVSDRIIIGMVRGEAEAGRYAAHYGLFFRPFTLIGAAAQFVTVPHLSSLANRRSIDVAVSEWVRTTRCVVIGGIGLGACTTVAFPFATRLIAPDYRTSDVSFGLAIAAAGVAYMFYTLGVQGLSMRLRSRVHAVNVVAWATFTVAATFAMLLVGSSIVLLPWISAIAYGGAGVVAVAVTKMRVE